MDRLVLSFRRESRQCPRQQKRSRDTPKRSARHSPTNERKSRRWYDIAYYLKTRGSPLYWPFMFATVLLQSIAVRVVLLLLAISLPVYFLSKHVDEKEFAKWGVRASAVQLGSPKEQVFGALPPLPQVDGQSVMTNQGHLIRWRVAKDICVVASFDPDSGTLNERMRVEKAQQSEVSAQRSEPAPAPQEARDAAKAWKEIPVHFKVILLVSIVITFAIRRRCRFTTARGPNPIGRGIASGTRDFWCFIAVYVGLALLWNLFVLIQKALF